MPYTKATDTHSEYVILTVFPRPQRLREHASMLYLYMQHISCLNIPLSWVCWSAKWPAVTPTLHGAASQEIPRISRNPKVHYRTHKRPPSAPILGQLNPVHIPTSHLLEIHHNIIHPSTPMSPQWSLSLRFPHQDPTHPPLLTHTRHMPSPSHSSRFIIRTILGEQYRLFSSSLCSLLHSPVTSSLLGPNILLSTLFSNTINFLCCYWSNLSWWHID